MEIEAAYSRRSGLSIAPLIDVVFLLLIFFLLTSALQSSTQLDVTLPKSEAGRDPDEDLITLEVGDDGQMAIGGQIISSEEAIEGAIVQAAGGTEAAKSANLLIKADGEAVNDSVLDVIEAAKRLQLNKVTLATIPQ